MAQEKLIVSGNGPLSGEVRISGAKNAALPLLAATLLTDDAVTLENVPRLHDIEVTLELLTALGASIAAEGDTVTVNANKAACCNLPEGLVRRVRGSILLLGPLLARQGEVRLPLPGGCEIGLRPIGEHIEGLRRMGAELHVSGGEIHGRCRQLKGATISLKQPSVTATENLIMAATTADGITVIDNAAREPEVVDLARLLNAMGANVMGHGGRRITIQACAGLHGAEHRVIPDRIESGTFLAAAAATRGQVTLLDTRTEFLRSILSCLAAAGCQHRTGEDWIRLDARGKTLRAVNVETGPYPAFPTDMQAQLMVLNAIAKGNSWIRETIFENRFGHVKELRRMGADIDTEGNTARIRGDHPLHGTRVHATDLRASASLVIAGLAAQGETIIDGMHHLERGYERIEHKLAGLGALIRRDSGQPCRRQTGADPASAIGDARVESAFMNALDGC